MIFFSRRDAWWLTPVLYPRTHIVLRLFRWELVDNPLLSSATAPWPSNVGS